MTITRIDPFRELASFFENFTEPTGKDQLTAGSFVPPVDVYEDEQNLILKLEVAGLNDEDVNVSVENNTLTVKGEKVAKTDQAKAEVLYQGIAARAFERVFRLADFVEVRSASLENGLLHIDLVREIPEAMKPRAIRINGGQNNKVIETKAAA